MALPSFGYRRMGFAAIEFLIKQVFGRRDATGPNPFFIAGPSPAVKNLKPRVPYKGLFLGRFFSARGIKGYLAPTPSVLSGWPHRIGTHHHIGNTAESQVFFLLLPSSIFPLPS
jgi:hypothetical protein